MLNTYDYLSCIIYILFQCMNIVGVYKVIVYDLKQEQNATQIQHKVHEIKETRRECPK